MHGVGNSIESNPPMTASAALPFQDVLHTAMLELQKVSLGTVSLSASPEQHRAHAVSCCVNPAAVSDLCAALRCRAHSFGNPKLDVILEVH